MIRIKLKKRQPLSLRKRLKNKARGRKKIAGSAACPRLSVFRSGRHIYAQLVDDGAGRTLTAASSLQLKPKGSPCAQAGQVGEHIGRKALENKIEKVVFDRGGFIYHGRVKALAEGARKAGLKF